MNRLYRIFILALVSTLSLVSEPACAMPGVILHIPDGTPIAIHSQHDISTHDVRTGDTVLFVTVHPLIVDGVTIVEEAAPVRAAAIVAEGAGFGHRGQLIVCIDSVQSADGSWIPLRTHVSAQTSAKLLLPREDERLTRARFPNGKDMDFPTNLTLTVFVDQTQNYALIPSDDGSAPHITPISATPTVSAERTAIKLPGGMPVVVQPAHNLSSDGERTGRLVDFIVSEPVLINGYTVIARGAKARGTVLIARHSSLLGSRGELAVSIDRVQAPDGSTIPLSFAQPRFGGGSVASTLLPPGLPNVLAVVTVFLPGSSAVMRTQRRLVAYVHDDRWFGAPVGADKATATLTSVPTSQLHVALNPPVVSEAHSDDLLSLRTSGMATVASAAEGLGASLQASSPTIYASWMLRPATRTREFEVVWLHEGRPFATQRALTVTAENTRGQTALSRPDSGFPKGHWTVVLQSNGRVLGTQNFDVTP